MRTLLIILASIVFIGGAGYLYASSGIKSKPGYVQLNLHDGEEVEPLITINLGPGGVGPARWLFKQLAIEGGQELDRSERILLSALKELRGVQLKVYKVDNNREYFDEAISRAVSQLRQQDWHPLVSVKDDGDHVVVMQIGSEQQISALSLMASTTENAVFVNLIGPFDPETFVESATSF